MDGGVVTLGVETIGIEPLAGYPYAAVVPPAPTPVVSTGLGLGAGPIMCEETRYGSLAIDDIDMHTPAWCLPDLSSLWGTPALRGTNRLIPGKQGRKPYRLRLDQTQHSLPLLITGYCNSDGVPYEDMGIDWSQGLGMNMAFLQDNVAFPSGTANSTRLATLTLPSGNVRKSWVQILGVTGGLLVGGVMRATLDLVDTESKLIIGGEIFIDA